DRVYIPAYIGSYIKRGKLIEHARNGRTDLVEAWARIAVETIDKERTSKLEALNEAEKNLLASVNDAFDRTERANSIVTAHLNSILKINKAQDEVLNSFKLKDTRDQINTALADASRMASKITEDIDKTASQLKPAETH
ncbi:MAG TPA: hypothetical protein PLK99_06010, partial [Burkholderiales bacterium]|nr:hypothetical protein [Burkholderiales bacterium]